MMSKKQDSILSTLRDAASKSPIDRRCAAMIVHRGNVMAVGYNRHKRHHTVAKRQCVLCA